VLGSSCQRVAKRIPLTHRGLTSAGVVNAGDYRSPSARPSRPRGARRSSQPLAGGPRTPGRSSRSRGRTAQCVRPALCGQNAVAPSASPQYYRRHRAIFPLARRLVKNAGGSSTGWRRG
jgi:hypothetical protein